MTENRYEFRSVVKKFDIAFANLRKSNQEFSSALTNLIKETEIWRNRKQVRQLKELKETLADIERLIKRKENMLEL